MDRNNVKELFFLDAILHEDISPEEREKEIKRLKEESDKLTDWLPM